MHCNVETEVIHPICLVLFYQCKNIIWWMLIKVFLQLSLHKCSSFLYNTERKSNVRYIGQMSIQSAKKHPFFICHMLLEFK